MLIHTSRIHRAELTFESACVLAMQRLLCASGCFVRLLLSSIRASARWWSWAPWLLFVWGLPYSSCFTRKKVIECHVSKNITRPARTHSARTGINTFRPCIRKLVTTLSFLNQQVQQLQQHRTEARSQHPYRGRDRTAVLEL